MTKGEITMAVSPSDAVTGRANYIVDAHAGYVPWPGGIGEVLSYSPGSHVVYFLPIRALCRTGLLRPGSEVLAVARQRDVLAWSSSVRCIVRVAGDRPQTPGSRVAKV